MLSSNPGRIKAELPVSLPRPRDRRDPAFEAPVDTVYGILTGREQTPTDAVGDSTGGAAVSTVLGAPAPTGAPLPMASPGGLSGLLEILAARDGEDGLAELADELSFEVDDLLPLVDAAVVLDLARTAGPRIALTSVGREFAGAGILTSKQLFARHAPVTCRWSVRSCRRSQRPETTCCARGCCWTCSTGASPMRTPAASSTPPSTGAATVSSSSTTGPRAASN